MFNFRWQSLAEKYKYGHGRCWMTIFGYILRFEWNFWTDFLQINLKIGGDEEQLQTCFAIPPVAFWLSIEAPYNSWLRKIVPYKARIMQLSMFEWSIKLVLWEKEHEWIRKDPWWVRGISFDLKDIFLGKQKFIRTEIKPPEKIQILLDNKIYFGTAKFERNTWKRRFWFTKSCESVWIDMDINNGLPHNGSGESEWNCGKDALYGFGVNGTDVNEAIEHGIKTVMDYRERYGN